MSEIGELLSSLTKPWDKGEIKFRVGSVSKDKKKALPLAYVDARSVMERLDSVMSPENWQDKYEFHGERSICYLSLRLDGEWITKADGAGDSDIEAVKGGISDAFKRAAVKWGMGRELYEIKCRWMPVDDYKQLIGDPWDFVINNKSKKKTKIIGEKLFDMDGSCYEIMAKMPTIATRLDFLNYWNSPKEKETRTKIKKINSAAYDELVKAKDKKLQEFDND